jgi:hypothetical protein
MSSNNKTCRVCHRIINYDEGYRIYATKNKNKKYSHSECHIGNANRIYSHNKRYSWVKQFEKLWITEDMTERKRLEENDIVL